MNKSPDNNDLLSFLIASSPPSYESAYAVGPADQAELRLEEIMTLQPLELAHDLPGPMAGDTGHGRLTVVVTNLPRHSAVRKLHERGATWLDVEWLPGFAPDLSPVEALWSHAKYTKLANFVPADFDRLQDAVAEALDEIGFRTSLMPSFFQAAKLSLTMAHSPRGGE